MTYVSTSQRWIAESTTLIEAQPVTTRITTKFTYRNQNTVRTCDDGDTSTTRKAYLTMKAYDPVSGVCIKYRTRRAAEIRRLVGLLGHITKTQQLTHANSPSVLPVACHSDNRDPRTLAAQPTSAPSPTNVPTEPSNVKSDKPTTCEFSGKPTGKHRRTKRK